ncbi:aminotransferase class V-fold PLP-dependent enzyme [Pusillimonas sp. TS35]|uniref:pyridoxal-phosphate-dependent aminotransferase family protein n=1 Tax=Paracandidimonas lactea TaxID=2895524 RepID=UPI00136AD9FC|nr:aminotransferase class V-fold PLP-dependent enzyme [Paracandidimonas lactea]MYN12822.1 aminotransferase class V-fold PLP-dependent enzyme [Pusillimonas sp. TS35]
MPNLNFHPAGRHYLQIPGPSPVPDRILRAISYPTIDHRGPEFGVLGRKVLGEIGKIFKTKHPVVIYPASGTGAWEAALSNTMSKGDTVLMYETGHFATLWKKMAERLGLKPEFLGLPGIEGWRRGVQADMVEARLKQDAGHTIKAVCVVHNETSTGVTSDIAAVRRAIDAAGHPALLMVDTISGLASADYRHDEWGVDVTVSGSQKGLMLPPGISFNALSPKALEASKRATLGRSFWAWDEIVEMNKTGYWPYTPNTNLLYGLSEALDMIQEEGLDNVFARHQRLAAACRAAVNAWGLEIQCVEEACHSPVLTGVMMPKGVDADQVRKLIYENFNMSLGAGLGKLKGLMFRIGHLGDANDLTLIATLGGCQMGLSMAGVALKGDGVAAAMAHLQATAKPQARHPNESSITQPHAKQGAQQQEETLEGTL